VAISVERIVNGLGLGFGFFSEFFGLILFEIL